MAFDIMKLELNRVVVFKDIEYRVLHVTDSGLLIVASEDDIRNNVFPLQTYAIPEE